MVLDAWIPMPKLRRLYRQAQKVLRGFAQNHGSRGFRAGVEGLLQPHPLSASIGNLMEALPLAKEKCLAGRSDADEEFWDLHGLISVSRKSTCPQRYALECKHCREKFSVYFWGFGQRRTPSPSADNVITMHTRRYILYHPAPSCCCQLSDAMAPVKKKHRRPQWEELGPGFQILTPPRYLQTARLRVPQ